MVSLIGRIFQRTETALAAVTFAVSMIFSLASPYFLTLSNATDLVEANSVTTILAAGVFVVLVSGGIDISFCAVASVTQYVAAIMATRFFGVVIGLTIQWQSLLSRAD